MIIASWAFSIPWDSLMIELSDLQAETICGSAAIVIDPTISISTSLIGSLQGNNGANVGVGVLGGIGVAGLSQVNGIKIIGLG